MFEGILKARTSVDIATADFKAMLLPGHRPGAAGSVVATWPGWPSHRCDPALTGAARSKLPRELRLLWRYDAGHPISATAAIADGRIFVSVEGGSLLALDATSGRRLWLYRAGASLETAPCLAGGRLFAGASDGTLHAVDAGDGSKLWTFKAGGEIKSHPVVCGSAVLFGSYDNRLYCLSAADGRELWKIETDAPVHCGPCVADSRAGRTRGEGMRGEGPPGVGMSAVGSGIPASSGGTSAAGGRTSAGGKSSGGGEGGAKPGGAAGEAAAIAGCDGFLRLIALDSGEEIASVALNDRVAASPAFDGRRFYFGTHGGRILCVGLEEKAILWEGKSRDGQPFFASAAIAGGGRVVFAGRDGIVRGLCAGDGRELWRFDTGSSVDSSPAIAGGRVFFGDKAGVLRALRLEDGREIWRFEAGGSFSAGPAIGCGVLAIGSDEGILYVFGGDPASAVEGSGPDR
ncbi:MAG: PQQ-binding-like beta-propeller repeat protein [Planctomycetota bacterium]|nr:PQQ-binding-like beta-propeller repeat protein [Planctomycetota bacterium]